MGVWYEKCDMCGRLCDLDNMVRYRGYDRRTGEPEPDNIWRWVDKKCHAWAEAYGQDLMDENNRINS